MCKCADGCSHIPFFPYILQGIRAKHEITLEFEFMIDANSIPFDAALHSSVSQFRFGFFWFKNFVMFFIASYSFLLNHNSAYAAKIIWLGLCFLNLTITPRFELNLFHFFPKPFVPKKAPRSVKAAQALRKDSTEQANTQLMRRESSESPPIHPLSRESSEIIASQALRKTEVKIETQPNGSEVTTTIMEIADPVKTF